MQKVSHFWAQMKKTQNVSEDVFAQSPSIIMIILVTLIILLFLKNTYWLQITAHCLVVEVDLVIGHPEEVCYTESTLLQYLHVPFLFS